MDNLPNWLRNLEETDLHFIKRMILASGSLKQLATEYEVSYPTIRQRLDQLIKRIQLFDQHPDDDPLVAKIRLLVSEQQLDGSTGKELLALYRSGKE